MSTAQTKFTRHSYAPCLRTEPIFLRAPAPHVLSGGPRKEAGTAAHGSRHEEVQCQPQGPLKQETVLRKTLSGSCSFLGPPDPQTLNLLGTEVLQTAPERPTRPTISERRPRAAHAHQAFSNTGRLPETNTCPLPASQRQPPPRGKGSLLSIYSFSSE